MFGKGVDIIDTLKYYNDNALEYSLKTRYGDMKEAYDKFLSLLPNNAHILDFGCGSGRDSKYFLENNYKVTAIDGSEEMCKLATKYINQEVKCMKFNELNDYLLYDGIWACASILHVKRDNLKDILIKMRNALKDNGIIYTSFKIGNYEIIEDNKYYNYIIKDILERILNNIDLEVINYYENSTCPNVDRPKTKWGNYLIKKK